MKKESNSIVLEARNSTKRFGTLLAVDDLNLQIRTAEGFGGCRAQHFRSAKTLQEAIIRR